MNLQEELHVIYRANKIDCEGIPGSSALYTGRIRLSVKVRKYENFKGTSKEGFSGLYRFV